jgi:hypothetical protein
MERIHKRETSESASKLKPTEEIRLRALREGVFAYLAWVPAEGYTWRRDLKPWPPPRPTRHSDAVDPFSGLPRWIDRDPTPDPPPYLVGPTPPGVSTLMHPRGVLREGRHRNDGLHDGLHRAFAKLADPDQIKAFADRHGDLGQLAGTQLSLGVGNAMWYGESLALWTREIAAMGQTLEAWDRQQASDGPADDVRGDVNARLRGHVHPRLLPPGAGEYRIVFTPDSLLAALYVLFALEVAKDEPRRVCAYKACGQVFTPRRRNQHYCSDSCRRNASYHRVKAKGDS